MVATTMISTLPSAAYYIFIDAEQFYSGEFTPRLSSPELECGSDGLLYYFSYTISDEFSSSLVSSMETNIETWNSDTYCISIDRTTSYGSSLCDFRTYSGSEVDDYDVKSLLGYTLLYFGDGAYAGENTGYYDPADMPLYDDYHIVEIYLNTEQLNSSKLSTNLEKMLKITATHEMGHALGLGHITNNKYLMYQSYEDGTTPLSPLEDEQFAIYELYHNRIGDN